MGSDKIVLNILFLNIQDHVDVHTVQGSGSIENVNTGITTVITIVSEVAQGSGSTEPGKKNITMTVEAVTNTSTVQENLAPGGKGNPDRNVGKMLNGEVVEGKLQ